MLTVCRNGKTGEELHRVERPDKGRYTTIRTQRTKLQSALLAHVRPGSLQLSKRLEQVEDLGDDGVRLYFADGAIQTADLVVGADGIRSVRPRCSVSLPFSS